MISIRFKSPTDDMFDQGEVQEFDDHIATLYLERGVAEMPMGAAVRIAAELHTAETVKDAELAGHLRDELATLANSHLTQDQRTKLAQVTATLHGEPAVESVEVESHKRQDKMVRPEKVHRKAMV